MDEKYIWPLVGVALGWALSLIASIIKERAEDRRRIGILIAKLMVVYQQVEVLKTVSEQFKDNVDGWESYERMRKGISDRHFLEPASHVDSLRKAIDDVSGLFPIEALSLQGLVDMLIKNKKASLSASAKSRDLYVRALAMYEVGLDLSQAELAKAIRRFSYRHGMVTYVRARRQLTKHQRVPMRNQEFVSKFTTEMFAELKRAAGETETPNPSLERTSTGKALGPQGSEV